jgi:hypothetical protein
MLQMNNEGQRGIMVAQLKRDAARFSRRIARLQADIDAHLKFAVRLEMNLERFSVVDIAAFGALRQKSEALRDALRSLHEHWQASEAIVEYDILGGNPDEIQQKAPGADRSSGQAPPA